MKPDLLTRLDAWDAGHDGSVDICYEAAAAIRELQGCILGHQKQLAEGISMIEQLDDATTDLLTELAEAKNSRAKDVLNDERKEQETIAFIAEPFGTYVGNGTNQIISNTSLNTEKGIIIIREKND